MQNRRDRIQILIINNAYAADVVTPLQLLDRYFLLTGWAEGLRSAGLGVTVLQRFHRDAVVERANITYEFVADGYGPRLRAWQIPWRLHRRVRNLCCASLQAGERVILHMNGLLFPLQTRHLRQSAPPDCALVVQHHAERPWPGWRSPLQRWGLRMVDGALFTNRVLAQEWQAAGVFDVRRPVYEVMECSSQLTYTDRNTARAVTNMAGAPILFWAGNLTSNKDPLTILTGFEQLLADYPAARLYMAYREAQLLAQVQNKIVQSEALRNSVHLLGELAYSEIGNYYNSADLFVQGSAKEGSGVALLDALACGVVPVVTAIPAFRTITQEGAVGALWQVGDVASFVTALHHVLARPLTSQSQQTRTLFNQHWSYAAIGQRAAQIYQEVLQRRQT